MLITGADTVEMLQEKIVLARSFVQLDEAQRQALVAKAADRAGAAIGFYKMKG